MKDKKITVTVSPNAYKRLKESAEVRHAGTSERVAVALFAGEVLDTQHRSAGIYRLLAQMVGRASMTHPHFESGGGLFLLNKARKAIDLPPLDMQGRKMIADKDFARFEKQLRNEWGDQYPGNYHD